MKSKQKDLVFGQIVKIFEILIQELVATKGKEIIGV